jgi:hypothetical protein
MHRAALHRSVLSSVGSARAPRAATSAGRSRSPDRHTLFTSTCTTLLHMCMRMCMCMCMHMCGLRHARHEKENKKLRLYISCLKKRPVKQARTTVVVKSQRSLFPCTHDTLPYASLVPPHLAPCGCATRAVAYPPQHTPHSSLPVRPPSARLLYAFLHFTRLPSFRARLLSTPSRAHSSCRRCP